MRVVFFDYWTKGIHNFVPVAKRLCADGVCVKLVHLGSWRDPTGPDYELLHDIDCYDIRKFGGSLRRALTELKPNVLVTLNTTMTMDRTVVRLCRSMDIKTVYLMHGIHAVGTDVDEVVAHQNAHWTLAKRIRKIGKYSGICAGYLGSIARDAPLEILDPRTYGHFVQMALWPGESHARPWHHRDVYCDRALVYAKVYRDSMIMNIGYPSERVRVVGNPNLDTAYSLVTDTEARYKAQRYLIDLGVPPSREAVVYMEDAFPEQGIGGWTEQTRISELQEIADAVADAGYDLIIKMHPGSDSRSVIAAFAGTPSVHVLLNADLAGLIFGCTATIGHVSTTLLYSIVFDRPLLVPVWSPGLERFGYYVSSGAATPVASPKALTAMLAGIAGCSYSVPPQLDQFIEEFITYTDGRSLDRIVQEVFACAES